MTELKINNFRDQTIQELQGESAILAFITLIFIYLIINYLLIQT